MKAAIYEAFEGAISIRELADPVPTARGVVIEVGASGLCLSDWHGWMGHDPDIKLPHVPGHELAGTVVAAGKDVRLWKGGERVTLPFVCGCGNCKQCATGNQQVCDYQFQPGFTAWGSFAQYVAIDYADENLVRLPTDMNFEEAASLGCRFITAYRAVKMQGKLQPGQWVAIHGCGGVGLSAIQIANALGAHIIAIDINEASCKLAKVLGATHVINAQKTNVVENIRDLSGGGVHLSLDAVGAATSCENSVLGLRKRGRHIQVGLLSDENNMPQIPMPQVIAHELEILGSHGMQAHVFPELFKFLKTSQIDLKKMVHKKVALEQIPNLLPQLNSLDSAGIYVLNSF